MEDQGGKWWLRPELEFTEHIDSWNVRASPSLDSEVVGVLKAGELFTALSVDGDWVQLQRNGAGAVGWSLRCLGQAEALAPAGHGASPVDSVPAPPPIRRNSRAEIIGDLVAELGERRRELGGLAASEPSGSARVVRAASGVQATMAKLELHGVDQEALLGIEGHDALAEIDKVVDALCRDLDRTTSFQHSDFTNPEAESCWLSTFFQSLWHSRVFHSTFDRLVRPLPRAEGGSAANALRDTWELYEREAAQGNVVSVAALVEAWGHGYGDCAEAFGKLQSDPALAPLAAQFALVPIEFTGSTLPPAKLWENVLQTEASDRPLLALELMLPYVNNAAVFKLVRDVMPVNKSDADLGDDHRLVAMICFMESFAHYVVFCRRMSDPNRWLLFNDLPAAPMQRQSGGMLSGIGSTIAQGMAFGTGSAIAHRAVGAVANSFGGSDDEAAAAPVQQQTMDNSQMANTQFCATDKQMFYECLQMNKGDQESCRFLYDALRDCQLNSAHM